MRIILTGGGTCGHIMPNIALLPELEKHFDSIAYFGADQSMEQSICLQHDIPFYYTKTIKLERRKIWRNAMIPYVLGSAVSSAKQLLKILKPNVVFSKGGYASLPTCLACKSMDIPYVIHESDSSLGVANRLASCGAARIILSSAIDQFKDNNRYVTIGNPIRDEIAKGNKNNLPHKLGNKKTILVMGGSLGAVAINQALESALPQLLEEYNVLHLYGNNNQPLLAQKGYYPTPFTDSIGDYYAAADIVISRAGANAISEINAVGKRAIYIPLPKGNSRGDQELNAMAQRNANRAIVINQEVLSGNKLINAIKNVNLLPAPKPTYGDNVNKRIVDVILSVARA